MDKSTYNSLRIRFSWLAGKWLVPANAGEHRRARSIIQSPSPADVDDLVSLMMLAYVEADASIREVLFAAGNEGKLFYHIKNKVGSAGRHICVQLPKGEDGEEDGGDVNDGELADEASDPVEILSASEDLSIFDDFAARLDEINGIGNDAWAVAVGLKESEARALKYRAKREQINNLLGEAAKAASITRGQLGRLKAQYLTVRQN